MTIDRQGPDWPPTVEEEALMQKILRPMLKMAGSGGVSHDALETALVHRGGMTAARAKLVLEADTISVAGPRFDENGQPSIDWLVAKYQKPLGDLVAICGKYHPMETPDQIDQLLAASRRHVDLLNAEIERDRFICDLMLAWGEANGIPEDQITFGKVADRLDLRGPDGGYHLSRLKPEAMAMVEDWRERHSA